MKQSDNPDEFRKKYGFLMTIQMAHPEFKDQIHFEGLEANYVSTLEHRIKHLEKMYNYQNEKIDFLMNKEFYNWKEWGNKNDK